MFNSGREDVFIEKIVKRRMGTKDFLLIGLYVLAFLVVLYLVFLFLPYLFSFALLIVVGAAYGLYFLITRRDLEFEYVCTNGTLDIDVIVHKRSRKRKLSAKAQNMEIVAPVSSSDYKSFEKSNFTKMDLSSNTDPKRVWFFVTEATLKNKNERVLVLFEPDDRILTNLRRFNPSKVQYNPHRPIEG